MKKRLHRNADARKLKMKARMVRRDFQTESSVTVIPAGSVVEWVGRRADYVGVNVNWNDTTYAISKDAWDGGEDIDEQPEDDS